MIVGLTTKELLGLSVVGTFVATCGSLLATILKEHFFSRSFEKWKRSIAASDVYQRYKDPIFLSGLELLIRLREIVVNKHMDFLTRDVLERPDGIAHANDISDPHFRHYKLISTLYRLCAFFGWLELYRREITFLDSGKAATRKRLAQCLHSIREDLADGQINRADNWHEWMDRLIYREELRAIGEAMLTTNGDKTVVLGYGAFQSLTTELQNNRWIELVIDLVRDLIKTPKDFRYTRLKRLALHIFDLLEELDEKRIPKFARSYRTELDDKNV